MGYRKHRALARPGQPKDDGTPPPELCGPVRTYKPGEVEWFKDARAANVRLDIVRLRISPALAQAAGLGTGERVKIGYDGCRRMLVIERDPDGRWPTYWVTPKRGASSGLGCGSLRVIAWLEERGFKRGSRYEARAIEPGRIEADGAQPLPPARKARAVGS